MGWVDRPISEEIDRIAAKEVLTRSKAIRNQLHWAVNQKLHLQTAALIPEGHERRIDNMEDKARIPQTRTASLPSGDTALPLFQHGLLLLPPWCCRAARPPRVAIRRTK